MHVSVRKTLDSLSSYRPTEIGRLDLAKLPKNRRVFDDSKVSDHHAIVPTGQLPPNLAGDRQRVFDAIVTRLIAVFYPPSVKAVTTVDAEAAGVPFRAKGAHVVDRGWTALYPSRRSGAAGDKSNEQPLPAFEQGESGPHEPHVEQKETTAPRPFSEASLLGAMETAGRLVDDEALREALKERGLGTPATRASIIEVLLRRGYIEREKKALRATDLGRYLIAIIADEQLKSPEMTGEWEARLKGIEKGTQNAGEFMREIADYIRGVVAASPLCVTLRSDVLGECPRCGAAVIEGKRSLGCSRWRGGCGFVLPLEYRGVALNTATARELLQRRIVSRTLTIDGAARVLRMTAGGAVEDIEVPSRDRQPGKGGKAANGGKAAGRGGTRAKSGTRRQSTGASSSTMRKQKAAALSLPSSALCSCPRCGRPIIEGQKGYGCSGWRDGCSVTVWKEIAGKKITKSMASKVLTKGRTQVLKGFVGKSGKAFDARLVWREAEGKVGFEFA
jgi:DNA topoisomerase-3